MFIFSLVSVVAELLEFLRFFTERLGNICATHAATWWQKSAADLS